MKKAILELDTVFSLLTFRYKGINLTTAIPSCIKQLELLVFDETGYMEFNTNVGVESMDLLYDTDHLLTKAQIKTIKTYLQGERNIEVRCI